jgi:hypothetical protein|tara:strand:- start:372 stop:818 length:447 start_codon:yes stop_codon:yes gene_type:complete
MNRAFYYTVFEAPKREVNKVFLHCSASDRERHSDVSVIRRWHLDRGWNDVGYHFFITRSGIVQTGRPLNDVPAAQHGHNKGSIAICVHGDNQFADEQLNALKSLCMAIRAAYGDKKVTFHGHCEVSSKTCPNFDYKTILNLTPKGFMR